MLRSKRGPALFDFLPSAENGGGLRRTTRPGTIVSPPASAATDASPATGTGRTGPGSPRVAVDTAGPSGALAWVAGEPEVRSGDAIRRGWIEVDGERVCVSFSSVTAAIAVFLLLTGLLGAFEIGKRRGEASGRVRGIEEARATTAAEGVADDVESVRSQPPSSDVVRSLLREPGGTGGLGSANTTGNLGIANGKSSVAPPRKAGNERWIPGRTYIVVQEFGADKEEFARRAQGFLASKSVATAIVGGPSGSFRLITTEGYNRQDAAERRVSEQALARVHALGEEYYRDGGGYRLQGYFATLKGEGW